MYSIVLCSSSFLILLIIFPKCHVYGYMNRFSRSQIYPNQLRIRLTRPKWPSVGLKAEKEPDPGDRKQKSVSKDKAISALSQPNNEATNDSGRRLAADASPSLLPPPVTAARTDRKSKKRTTIKRSKTSSHRKGSRNLTSSSHKTQRKERKGHDVSESPSSYSSLLPPPLPESLGRDGSGSDQLSSGLSSWEEFLGVGGSSSGDKSTQPLPKSSSRKAPSEEKDDSKLDDSTDDAQLRLPSIEDLFPPDLSSTAAPSYTKSRSQSKPKSKPTLDGVLPVSDLFYSSSRREGKHDDEELPFSAEQSDALTSENNKVTVRRNLAQTAGKEEMAKKASATKKRNGRKMVRRGMEMLVGGVPINADPPQRSVQLLYDQAAEDWAATISLNTRDFGPLLHAASIPTVMDMERGLFCEYWCHSTMKWDICPKDLRQIVKTHSIQQMQPESRAWRAPMTGSPSYEPPEVLSAGNSTHDKDASLSVLTDNTNAATDDNEGIQATTAKKRNSLPKAVGFGKESKSKRRSKDEKNGVFVVNAGIMMYELTVSKSELESGDGGAGGAIFHSVLKRAAETALKKELSDDFQLKLTSLNLKDYGGGSTIISFELGVENLQPMTSDEAQQKAQQIIDKYSQLVDTGEIGFSIAAAAKEETRWPQAVRDRVVEECLIEDDLEELGEATQRGRKNRKRSQSSKLEKAGSPLFLAGPDHVKDDLSLESGSEGLFPDYLEPNVLNAPYKGEIGLRLVDAVVERSKQRQPRVIAIGDVHGCIDELQDLLRECDYRPGDLVIFLGDLVCKGPDSISVVQMAREIGALGVRGNHDFEVIRWHQAIKSGVDPPVVGSEHYHIASCLSNDDMKWMYNLPWYVSSKDLGSLFVHAGFVSGIRLAKQNPRLMMNMRSILPDGTVTSKFFSNWPWARLWDGPQTVLFGHDADRGLQQYEHAIGLDTGCVYGGRLTACILPEKRLVSVSARREYFKYRRRHYD